MGGQKRVTRKKFFKYGHVIYRWKLILMLISDFKEFFQNFNFWTRGGVLIGGAPGDAQNEVGHVIYSWKAYLMLMMDFQLF